MGERPRMRPLRVLLGLAIVGLALAGCTGRQAPQETSDPDTVTGPDTGLGGNTTELDENGTVPYAPRPLGNGSQPGGAPP